MTARTRQVVVTGAAGFIGSALTRRLAGDGATVVGIDNERSGRWSRSRAACEVVDADLADLTVEELVGHLTGADVCFHLAAEKYNSSKSTPQRVIDVNISATQRLFEAAARAGVPKVVFTSSLYAYGSMGPAPMAVTDLPAPTTVYGMSKVAGEHLLRVAQRDFGLRWAVARLFFVYGPDQYAEGGYRSVIVANFDRLRRGEAPTIFGDGAQRLDYVYLDDVVAGLIELAEPRHDGAVVNLGSGDAPTIVELTEAMLRASGLAATPVYGPADWTAGSVRVADIEHTRATMDWRPTVGLDEGLRRIWEWTEAHDVG